MTYLGLVVSAWILYFPLSRIAKALEDLSDKS